MMRGLRKHLLVVLSVAMAWGLAAPAFAETPRVEVGDGQTTTVVGEFKSLSRLLDELCERAGVELRSNAASDRPVSIDQRDRPLRDVLERLLSHENYLLGVRTGTGESGDPSHIEVAWIRVTGTRVSETAAVGLTVPSRFGGTDFEREDPADAHRAHAAVAERLLADEAGVAAFLRADADALARSLGQYPHIDVLLRKLKSEQEHAEVRNQLDAVLAALAALQPTKGDPSR